MTPGPWTPAPATLAAEKAFNKAVRRIAAMRAATDATLAFLVTNLLVVVGAPVTAAVLMIGGMTAIAAGREVMHRAMTAFKNPILPSLASIALFGGGAAAILTAVQSTPFTVDPPAAAASRLPENLDASFNAAAPVANATSQSAPPSFTAPLRRVP